MITVLSFPSQDIYPAYNPQLFTASSNQTGQPNFNYFITVEDDITGETTEYLYPARPDGKLVFNAGVFAKQFIEQVVPEGFGFKVNTGAYRKIIVNVGESYGTTPAEYPGDDYTYYIWNMVLGFKEYPSYQVDNYRYNTGANLRNYLTNNVQSIVLDGNTFVSEPEFTFNNRSNYLYALTTDNGDFQTIIINSYDGQGNPLGSSQIANPFTNSANYIEKYQFIDLGKKGLDGLTGGQVTGTYPVLPAGTAYYDVLDATIVVMPPSTTINKWIRRYYIKCEPRYDVISAHYLAKKGQFESFHFAKLSERTSSKTTTTYKKTPWYLGNDDVYTYNTTATVENTLSTSITDRIKLFSDWVSENQIKYLKELFASPLVYLDDGDFKIVAKPLESTYFVKKNYNEQMFFVSLEFEYTYKDFTQNA